MWRKALIGFLIAAFILAAVPGCGLFSGKDTTALPGDETMGGDDEGPAGEIDDGNDDPGEDTGTVEDPGWEITFTALDMFSGRQVNFPADFTGEVIYLGFYFYG